MTHSGLLMGSNKIFKPSIPHGTLNEGLRYLAFFCSKIVTLDRKTIEKSLKKILKNVVQLEQVLVGSRAQSLSFNKIC